MKCFVCQKSNGRITRFTDASFEKCMNLLAFRKLKKFKYWEADLSYESRGDTGYHGDCYKLFAVLKSKYRPEFDSLLLSKQNLSAPPVSYPFVQDNQPNGCNNFETIYFEYMPEILPMKNLETECYQPENENSTIPEESKAEIIQPTTKSKDQTKDRKDFHERKPKKQLDEPFKSPYFTRKRYAVTKNSKKPKITNNYTKKTIDLPYTSSKRRRGRPRKHHKIELEENRSISSNKPQSELQNSEDHKEDEADVFAKGVAVKLRKLCSENLKIIVQRDIDMLLYEAIIGTGRYSYGNIEREFSNSYSAFGQEFNGYLESTVKIEETELQTLDLQ